jgi:hypothetical protein
MFHFVSMVAFEGRLFGMTDTGAVWRFQPGFDGAGIPNGQPKWTHLSDGPHPPEQVFSLSLSPQSVADILEGRSARLEHD